MKKLFLSLVLALSIAPINIAAAQTNDANGAIKAVTLNQPLENSANFYDIDKSHTSILFFIDHLGFSKMVGEFHDYSGGFVFDEENVENSKVDVTVNVASVDTDVEKLNEHLRAPDFFNVEKYPTARFVSTKVEKTGKNTGIVYGDFTMMGVTKPIKMDVKFNKAGKFPMNDNYVAGFEGRAKIVRSAFNMTNGLPMIGDEVDLLIHTEGVRKDSKKTN